MTIDTACAELCGVCVRVAGSLGKPAIDRSSETFAEGDLESRHNLIIERKIESGGLIS